MVYKRPAQSGVHNFVITYSKM